MLLQACASLPSLPMVHRAPPIPPQPIPSFSPECRLAAEPRPEFETPPDLPTEPVARANAVAGAAIGYARALQIHADGLAATIDRCAGENERNASDQARWAAERARILDEEHD